jgi:hypothetical protein
MHTINGPVFFASIIEDPYLLGCDAASPDYISSKYKN